MVVARLLIAIILLLAADRASAQPASTTIPACVTATPACTEWIALGPGGARSMVYRSFPLEVRRDAIRRALVMVHGQGRNANDYFRTAVAAALLAGALDDTIIVAPRFASRNGSCNDTLEAGEVNWPCGGNSWRAGGVAVDGSGLTSFDFADAILRKLARRDVFPNPRTIVIAGHSAGGQFASRYQMANTLHEQLGVAVSYVVSNPSSYAYPVVERPSRDGSGFGPFPDARNCTTFDQWPYGLRERSGYAARLSDEQLRSQLVTRPATYLMGELDTTPLAGFDASCPAMAQGPNRFERARAFHRLVTETLGARHAFVNVPLCGHSARCVFTSDVALPVLFPDVP